MRLISLKLENIRSYLNETIDFPDSTLLIEGDIGSGKSTILLSIEFALFGIMPGTLSGNALLRNGASNGSVELKLEIENKEIIIKRFLKRQKEKVVQQAGYIIRDNVKKEATPVELKAIILELLGYPKELLTKSKNMIYRYTVYTPQEEMKRILKEDKDIRLDILRKVFGIDKYKRVRENTSICIRSLKEKSRTIEGIISDLEEKQMLKKELQSKISDVEKRYNEALPRARESSELLNKKKQALDSLETEIKECTRIKSQIAALDAKLSAKVDERQRLSSEISGIGSRIMSLKEELSGKDEEIKNKESIEKDKEEKEKKLNNLESRWRELLRITSKLKAKQDISISIEDKISAIEKCPLCLQDVSKEHKSSIHERESKNINEIQSRLLEIAKEESKISEEKENLKEELKQISKKHQEKKIIELKQKSLRDMENQKAKKEEIYSNLKLEVGSINAEKIGLNEKLKDFLGKEEAYKLSKKEIEKIQDEERYLALGLARLEKEKEGLLVQLGRTDDELRSKLDKKAKLDMIRKNITWLEEHFMNLMVIMEKQVMARIYNEFNDVFREWFSIMLEDEVLSVSLDDEFTPVIEQNGYEIEIDHLSGGEKTSLALAYRVALNKVINDVISEIKTKNIIILDEPTEGFSSEQLDKVKDILDSLGISQIILVSHEAKTESFVDNVIKVVKNEHVSTIV